MSYVQIRLSGKGLIHSLTTVSVRHIFATAGYLALSNSLISCDNTFDFFYEFLIYPLSRP